MIINYIFLFLVVTFVVVDSVSGSSCSTHSGGNSNSSAACGKCVGESLNCYWCKGTSKCVKRDSVIVGKSECDGTWYSWGQCTVPGIILVIVVPIVAFVVLLIIGCCIYCICCRDCCKARKTKKWAKEDVRNENKKKEREDRHTSKDEERKLKHDQIRMKYGLFKDDQTKYQKFDAS